MSKTFTLVSYMFDPQAKETINSAYANLGFKTHQLQDKDKLFNLSISQVFSSLK